MNRITIHRTWLYCTAICIILSACKTTKKTTTAPPVTTVKEKPVEEKKEEAPKPEVKPPFNVPAFAQEVKRDRYNVAIFVPLYLDSLFITGDELPGRQMPRFVVPGLEFYEGAQLALDTLQKQGYKLNVFVYDSKARGNDPSTLVRTKQLEAMDLIIGSVTPPEIQILSDFAKQKQINFVSATYPNDAGITGNPFYLIANSTLKTHCNAIQNYVQKAFANKNILVFKRASTLENMIASDIKESYTNATLPTKSRIREVVWNENTPDNEIAQYLLTDRPNICIITALDEPGSKTIVRKLSTQMSKYPVQIFGMPTWDVMKFKEPEFDGMSIYYSSPYFVDKNSPFNKYVGDYFRKNYRINPSDNALKGFEFTYYFIKLMGKDGIYFNKDINDSPYKVFTNFNFQPIYLQQQDSLSQPSYFENQQIYIIQKGDSADFKMQ